MFTAKTEVVSVRVEPNIKAALQAAAKQERRSLANMVEVMVLKFCHDNGIAAPDIGAPAQKPAIKAKTGVAKRQKIQKK